MSDQGYFGENAPLPPAPGEDGPDVEDRGPYTDRIVVALKTVYDPEIPVNIYDLGLIYKIVSDSDGEVQIDMTLTAPGCPVAEEMPLMVERAVLTAMGITKVGVEVVWDPPWTPARMTEAAKLELGMF